MTEYSYALQGLRNLEEYGWVIRAAGDQESTIVTDDARQALDYVQAIEHGAIRLAHPVHGSAALSLLFQGGEACDVIYDIHARTPEALEIVSAATDLGGH